MRFKLDIRGTYISLFYDNLQRYIYTYIIPLRRSISVTFLVKLPHQPVPTTTSPRALVEDPCLKRASRDTNLGLGLDTFGLESSTLLDWLRFDSKDDKAERC